MTDAVRIQLLDEHTANQIAAGEVVERPASVVKELCENSLDAGARRIAITVADGGRSLIEVTDDASGLSRTEAELALQRHATSKIRTAADLAAVQTLGFRGEALPSIAAVSRFTLVSRRPGDPAAVRVETEGGKRLQWSVTAAPTGTTVSVRDLFFNTPARQKFLRSARSELHAIVTAVVRLALARPDVAFRLTSAGKQLLSTPGSGDPRDAVLGALGRELAAGLLPLPEPEEEGLTVRGYVGKPDIARSNRQQQHFFINGRPVRSAGLGYALEEAYRGLLMQGRYPVAVLYVTVPPGTIDVNVHPTKEEVRFENEQAVRSAVYRAAQAALSAEVLIPGHEPWRRPAAGGTEASPAAPPASASQTGFRAPAGFAPQSSHARQDSKAPPSPRQWAETVRPYLEAVRQPAPAPVSASEGSRLEQALLRADAAAGEPAAVIRQLIPLGQLSQTYILCQGPDGLYIVDQHAAHERVFFDQLGPYVEAAAAQVQYLALPVDVELTAAELALWEEHQGDLAAYGLIAEPFGGQTLLIKAVPPQLSAEPPALVREILDFLASGRSGADAIDRRLAARRAMAACKAAIKANEPLGREEMQGLLDLLAAADEPFTCPHGRPTVICVSHAELERRFRRRV